tara:strand:+ start:108 stop:491 length:384 start_codon:yes stop_codon:yes gene_type:complete
MALGKIKADTLEHSTAGTVDTQFVVNGSAKQWVNLDGTGTAAIQDSLNCTSFTDGGTGDYQPNFVNAMGNANYSVNCTGGDSGDRYHGDLVSKGSATTSLYRTYWVNTSASANDCDIVCTSVHGDLA